MKAEDVPSRYKFKPGDKVDRNTILQFVGHNKWESRLYLCKCECGEFTLKSAAQLRSGKSRSCGCLSAEISSVGNRVHGQRKESEYKCWVSMKQRCLNPKNRSFKDYGSRGIVICKRWMTFANFFRDMGRRPDRSFTLERNDNALGYNPKNCRWATKRDQSLNRRSSVIITAFGETKHLVDWTRDPRLACRPATFEKRIYAGWSMEKAFSTPTIGRKK